MIKYDEFKERVSIVTGGALGCGKAISQALARQGSIVYILDINYKEALQTYNEISNEGGISYTIHCNISKEENIKAAIQTILMTSGRIDYVINNVGISQVGYIQDLSGEDFDYVYSVNAKGTFLMINQISKLWIDNKQKGSIVNICSESIFSHHIMGAIYNSSKIAQNEIGKTAARELAKYGIRVNSVHPSIISGTEMTKYLNERFKKEHGWDEETAQKTYLSKIPIGRFCTPEDVVKAVLWLLSDESEFVIGTDLMVSGGQAI